MRTRQEIDAEYIPLAALYGDTMFKIEKLGKTAQDVKTRMQELADEKAADAPVVEPVVEPKPEVPAEPVAPAEIVVEPEKAIA